MNRLPEAVACLERAIGMNPEYVESHRNLGIVLQLLGRAPEAEAQFAIVRRLQGVKN